MADKVIFLDRDGTINKEVNYLYQINNFEFISGAPKAIRLFHELGYMVIVVTNQSGVARGYYKETNVILLHNYINTLLKKENTYIDSFYYCPHHPEGVIKRYSYVCECRKPKVGMIKQASYDFDIDLYNSILIGDKNIDIQTGKNAGIGKNYLVRSGYKINDNDTLADGIFDNILDVAIYLKKQIN